MTTTMHYGLATYSSSKTDDADILKRFGHLVRRSAVRLAQRTGVNADELWSAGALGLLEAMRRYDASRNVKLELFVAFRIRGAMLDELRRMDRLPRRMRGRISEVARIRRSLAQEMKREPTRDEVATAAGIELAELEMLDEAGETQASLDDVGPVASEDTALDELVVSRERIAELQAATKQLPERLQLILSLRYQEDLTLKEIAGIIGVSEPRICQLHNAAVAKLRAALVA